MKNITKSVCSVLAIIGIMLGGVTIQTAELEPSAPPIGDVVINGKLIGTLIVSENALKVIGNAEGCYRNPYVCPAGLDTDGIGNTHGVTGETKTDKAIAADWSLNIIDAQSCLAESGHVDAMTQGQIDAFTSFIFNTGCVRFIKNRDGTKTKIYSLIHAGQFDAACDQLNHWVYGGGKKLLGLVNRRQEETKLCRGRI
jgi:lysozyme